MVLLQHVLASSTVVFEVSEIDNMLLKGKGFLSYQCMTFTSLYHGVYFCLPFHVLLSLVST